MRLSSLYTNKPDVFDRIDFRPGLNVVLAEIRDPRNRDVDTHNLGKTTLGRLLDFCLLKGTTPSHFLEKHIDRFADFAFFLEMSTDGGDFVTVRRGVTNNTRIWIKVETRARLDLSEVALEGWDYRDVAFSRARKLLDGLFACESLSPWGYRDAVGYLLRVQQDYDDVFRLDKHRGADVDWKPGLAHMLGLDGESALRAYELDSEIDGKRDAARKLRGLVPDNDRDRLRGLISIKESEVAEADASLAQFDFREIEREVNEALVDDTEREIAALNNERYYIDVEANQIRSSLDDKRVRLTSKKIQELFEESGTAMGEKLVRDLDAFQEFYRSITSERRRYLKKELKDRTTALEGINERLSELNDARREALEALRERETLDKYRKLSRRVSQMRADLEVLYHRRRNLEELQVVEHEIKELEQRREAETEALEDSIARQAPTYVAVRVEFARVIKKVVGRAAVLSTRVNSAGNLDFQAEFVTARGDATSEDEGQTYRKLLCVAFDLALLRAHLDTSFPRFAFHDGIFEALDDRKKMNLIETMEEFAGLGIQQVITTIDSDLPEYEDDTGERRQFAFADDVVVSRLHDLGEEGLLFHTDPW